MKGTRDSLCPSMFRKQGYIVTVIRIVQLQSTTALRLLSQRPKASSDSKRAVKDINLYVSRNKSLFVR